MTNPLIESIKCKVVEPALKDRLHMMRGVVLSYNGTTNRASVEIHNPYGVGKRTLEGVPVQMANGGVHSAAPFDGDGVWVNFIGGSIYNPRIVGFVDEDYHLKTREERYQHKRKGTYVPDTLMGW